MKKTILTLTVIFAGFGFSHTVFAFDFGSGTGCSAIGGIDATALTSGDTFTGRIGATGVSGFNKKNKPVDDTDGDGFTNSLEECINDALVGYCTTITGDDSAAITVIPGATSGRKNNKQEFTVIFEDVSGCGVSQCSDHVDNEASLDLGDEGTSDGLSDFPADPECDDYDDDDESDSGEDNGDEDASLY